MAISWLDPERDASGSLRYLSQGRRFSIEKREGFAPEDVGFRLFVGGLDQHEEWSTLNEAKDAAASHDRTSAYANMAVCGRCGLRGEVRDGHRCPSPTVVKRAT